MSKTIKDLAYFKEEVAKEKGFKTWLEMAKVVNGVTEHLMNRVAELYAKHKAEQRYEEGYQEGSDDATGLWKEQVEIAKKQAWNEALEAASKVIEVMLISEQQESNFKPKEMTHYSLKDS